MKKFTLKMEQPELNRSIEVTFKEEYLQDVLKQIDTFIRGCGYEPDGDNLEYVHNVVKSFSDSIISVNVNEGLDYSLLDYPSSARV